MPWLWWVAPLCIVVLYWLTSLPGRHDKRRAREIDQWRVRMAPQDVKRKLVGYRGTKETQSEADGPKRVTSLPGDLFRMLPTIGGGKVIAHYELLDNLAYVSIMGPDLTNGSEYQAVLARLEKPAPAFSVRPLPVIEGKRVANTGIQFKKDTEFMQLFLVQGKDPKSIGKWLPRSLRNALKDVPEAWLYLQGRVMALVRYGPVDADRLKELVVAADALFADHGDEGGPSLLLDDDDESAELAVAAEVEKPVKVKVGKGKAKKSSEKTSAAQK